MPAGGAGHSRWQSQCCLHRRREDGNDTIGGISTSDPQISELLEKLGADEEDHYKLVTSLVAPVPPPELPSGADQGIRSHASNHGDNFAGMVAATRCGLSISRPQSRHFPRRMLECASGPSSRSGCFFRSGTIATCENSVTDFITAPAQALVTGRMV